MKSYCKLVKRNFFIAIFSPLTLFAQYPDSIRLNDIRILASHNSYKKRPDERIVKFLQKFERYLSNDLDPKRMDYGHLPLTEQFEDYEIRGIELDLYNDPRGGHFQKRRINRFIRGLKQTANDSIMKQPGLKVLHIADIDYESNYRSFTEALLEIKAWSIKHTQHTPLFVNIEVKERSPGNYSRVLRFLGFKPAVEFDSAAYLKIDEAIVAIFEHDELLSPSLLRDTFATVNQRIQKIGWPKLNEVLGKTAFIFDGNGDEYARYSKEKVAFSYGKPEDPETAFVIRNNAIGKEEEIEQLAKHYIVRTRSDVETLQARENDYTLFDAAIRSDAQVISTDYYMPDTRLGSYFITLEPYKQNKMWPFALRKSSKQ
jgi:hypothetical protein